MSAEQIWNDLRLQRERPIFKRVNEAHPYDLYLGIDVQEAPVLMLLSSTSAEQLPRLRALEVSQNLRHDGKFAILISLAAQELLHPFCYVCEDLIESLRQLKPAGSEALFLLNRLEKWRRLLETTKKGLSQPQLLGLMGELLFLERLIPVLGTAGAVESWLGPTGAPQDFQTGGQIFEIKVCAIGAHIVMISSLEQLHTGAAPTNLIVYSIGSCATNHSGAFTIKALVLRIREAIAESSASSAFELKLAEIGYDQDQPESDSSYHLDNVRAFDVRDSFPRLTPVSVSVAIPSATYYLDLDHCTEFEIPTTQVLGYEP
ncbi:MAG TPA: PD-(D/E)XK motif protein [Terriglobales bacterium]|nr:PD-(D/E)XK motif protein [Terriglobales bacterium]